MAFPCQCVAIFELTTAAFTKEKNLEDIIPSKKVNKVATSEGKPFEIILSLEQYHDYDPFKLINLQLPKGSSLYGDSAYTDYEYEDLD